MKRIAFVLIFICFILMCMYPKDADFIKVLILPFKNNSPVSKSNLHTNLILETIKNDIGKVPFKISREDFNNQLKPRFKSSDDLEFFYNCYEPDIPGKYYILKQSLDIDVIDQLRKIMLATGYAKLYIPLTLSDFEIYKQITDYEAVYNQAVDKDIDLIITGFYIINDNEIRITFKVLDVLTERMKIVQSTKGEKDHGIFDVILHSTKDLIGRINDEIKPYPRRIGNYLREKQSRIIAGELKERFLFFNMGLMYSGTAFFNITNFMTDDINLKGTKNSYANAFGPSFNVEIYGSYKKNYYGVGFKFNVPFIYFAPNMQMTSSCSMGFLFGFLKKIFFDWSVVMYYNGFYKYSSFNNDTNLMVLYIGLGLGFTMRYMPLNKPYFIEGGFVLLLPYFYNYPEQVLINEGPSFLNITTGNTINKSNWICPVMIRLGFGYFFTNNVGIFSRVVFSFMNIHYNNYKREYSAEKGREVWEKYIYGQDFAVSYDLEIGFVYKGVFK